MSCTPTHGVFPEVKGRGWTTAAKGEAEFPPEWAGLFQTASFCRFISSEERKGKRETDSREYERSGGDCGQLDTDNVCLV